MRTAILVAIGLVIGNFLYEEFTDQNWIEATARSYFGIAGALSLLLAQFCK